MSLLSRHVLVVEDDYLQAVDVAHALRGAGANVVGPTPTVVEALVELERGKIDAAVLDISLGGETSALVAVALESREIPFIVLSGYERDQSSAFPPAADYFEKPASARALIAALERVVDAN